MCFFYSFENEMKSGVAGKRVLWFLGLMDWEEAATLQLLLKSESGTQFSTSLSVSHTELINTSTPINKNLSSFCFRFVYCCQGKKKKGILILQNSFHFNIRAKKIQLQ